MLYCNSYIHYIKSQQTHAFNFRICCTRIHLTIKNKLKIPDLATPKVRMEIIQRKTRYPVHLHLQKYRSIVYIFLVTCRYTYMNQQDSVEFSFKLALLIPLGHHQWGADPFTLFYDNILFLAKV